MTGYALAVSLLVWSANAQESGTFRRCMDKANTTHDMHVCAAEEAKRVEARLDQDYRKILSLAEKTAEREHTAMTLKKVKAAQAAWVIYRDAFIDAMFPLPDKQLEYGTMDPVEAAMARTALTLRQIEALKDLSNRYTAR